MIILPENKPVEARHIFVPACSNRLTVALLWTDAVFTSIRQKYGTRRMEEFYEYAA